MHFLAAILIWYYCWHHISGGGVLTGTTMGTILFCFSYLFYHKIDRLLFCATQIFNGGGGEMTPLVLPVGVNYLMLSEPAKANISTGRSPTNDSDQEVKNESSGR